MSFSSQMVSDWNGAPELILQLSSTAQETGRYKRTAPDFVERFRQHVARWRLDTVFDSSSTTITAHPDFKAIVGMGERAIPLIIEEIRYQPDHLVSALREITSENPVPQSDQGRMSAMASAWLTWYERRG